MLVTLTEKECRVIGVMLEKETTTPDQYPLSLNGLTTGCNQKSNREPVMQLSEAEVQDLLDDLRAKKQVGEQSGFGSRVVKYKHRFCNTEFGSLQLSDQQRAIVCVLLLRGPQTPGELRTRTQRLAEFVNVDEVEQVLQAMQDHNGEQLVTRLEREPGKREARYAHLFGDTVPTSSAPVTSAFAETVAADSAADGDRIDALEREVSELRSQITALTARLDELL